MEFLLTDLGVALAFLIGYMGVAALERRRARAVTLARRARSRTPLHSLPGYESAPVRRKEAPEERLPQPDLPPHGRGSQIIQLR
jgi:hypothetical protein